MTGLILQLGGCEFERDDRVHESLLRTVVQVPHDAPAFLVGGGYEAGA